MKAGRSITGLAALLVVVLSALSCSPLLPMSEDKYTLTRNGGVAAPVLNPPAGTYTTEQIVTITAATAGAAVRYTTDGSVPTSTSGSVYSAPLSVTMSQTIHVIAYKEGFADSVASATYTLRAVAPVFTPGQGNYADGQDVAISTTTSGATLRYTVDTSAPTSTSGLVYVGPVSIGIGALKAIACRSGWTDSAVSSATYGLVFTSPLYVAGAVYSNPCYWKNAIQNPLSWSGTGNGSTNAVALSGGSVYLAGADNTTPCYWKDGNLVSLPGGGGTVGYASSIFIDSHGNRHLAGTLGGGGSLVAAYWKNETLYALNGTFANGMTLDSSGSVYVVGCFSMSSSTPCYWKDGARTTLPMGTGDSVGTATTVAIDGSGNVFISGYSGNTSASAPCYWTNEVRNPLSIGAYTDGIATGVALDGAGNVYIVGGIGSSSNSHIPCYWKNGALNLLPLGGGNVYGSANAVALDSSGNIYICGSAGPTSSSLVPCYWRNGVHTALSTLQGFAGGIAVGP